MKVALLCGMGHHIPHHTDIDLWIGVDKGALTLIEQHIIPICAIGDFDSITEQQLLLIEQKVPHIIRLNKNKDLTDTEAAINYCIKTLTLEYDIKEIEIYGATGGRMDHFLANINNLSNLDAQRQHITLSIIDDQNKISILSAGHYRVKQEHYHYLSFIARHDGVLLTLKNVKYPLSRQVLHLTSSLTVSNEWLNEEAEVIVENGQIIMIKSKDK